MFLSVKNLTFLETESKRIGTMNWLECRIGFTVIVRLMTFQTYTYETIGTKYFVSAGKQKSGLQIN